MKIQLRPLFQFLVMIVFSHMRSKKKILNIVLAI